MSFSLGRAIRRLWQQSPDLFKIESPFHRAAGRRYEYMAKVDAEHTMEPLIEIKETLINCAFAAERTALDNHRA